ncbi:MAG: glycosyltransferase family 39 protein [Chloroflexota bacterium]
MKSPYFLARGLGSAPLLALTLVIILASTGHPASILRGFPLHPVITSIALPMAFLLWSGWHFTGWRGQRWLVGGMLLLVLIKVGLGLAAPEPGAIGSYYGRARLTDAPERSLDFRHLSGATRVDRSLDFDQYTLPVPFFNDNDRFNFYQPNEPDRQRLPLAVVWDGWITVPEARSYRVWLTAIGDARLIIDGSPVLSTTTGRADAPQADGRPLELADGPHPIKLEYQRRQGQQALISAEWDVRGEREPLGSPYLYVSPVPLHQSALEATRGLAAQVVDGMIIILAISAVMARLSPGSVGRPSMHAVILGLWGAGISAYGAATSLDLIGQSAILEGGQDWLTYEYYARDILLNGPLMSLGKALGQGRAFVFQPLYPYYLAGLHGLLGEGIFGVQVAHFAGFGIAGIILFHLARILFGIVSAWMTLMLSTILIVTQLDVVARRLLSENLYFFVLPAAILAVVWVGRSNGWRAPILAGVLLGIACLTRGPTLLIVPIAVIALLLTQRRRGAVVMLLAICLVVGLAPVRNYLVSGRPALVATNAGATLLLAHPPTEKVRLRGLDQHPLYNRLGIDRQTREVIEFVIQDPVGYAATLVPLAAYTLGFPGMVEVASPPAWELVILFVLYIAAIARLPQTRQRETWVAHAFVVSHFVVMITFLPYVYGYRQVLPMYVVMLPYCAAVLAEAFTHWWRPNATPATESLPLRARER